MLFCFLPMCYVKIGRLILPFLGMLCTVKKTFKKIKNIKFKVSIKTGKRLYIFVSKFYFFIFYISSSVRISNYLLLAVYIHIYCYGWIYCFKTSRSGPQKRSRKISEGNFNQIKSMMRIRIHKDPNP